MLIFIFFFDRINQFIGSSVSHSSGISLHLLPLEPCIEFNGILLGSRKGSINIFLIVAAWAFQSSEIVIFIVFVIFNNSHHACVCISRNYWPTCHSINNSSRSLRLSIIHSFELSVVRIDWASVIYSVKISALRILWRGVKSMNIWFIVIRLTLALILLIVNWSAFVLVLLLILIVLVALILLIRIVVITVLKFAKLIFQRLSMTKLVFILNFFLMQDFLILECHMFVVFYL